MAAGSEALTGSDRAIALTRERIADGRFRPYSQLPREIDLAKEFGVSRGALREAIRALELVGIVESRHGSGTYVTGLTASDLLHNFAMETMHIDAGSAAELVEFRRIVEPGSLALAATRATAEQIAEIRAIYDESEQVDDPVRYLAYDNALHRAIMRASGNTIVASLMESIAYGGAWDRMWRSVLGASVPERTRREHETMVIAVETHDVQLGLATAHAHLAGAERLVRRLFDDPAAVEALH